MATVYRRNDSPFLWAKWKDAAGEEHRRSLETADVTIARARAAELERQSRDDAREGELTAEGFARGEWLTQRKIMYPFAWKDDLSRLEHHFLPEFGARSLTWLATDDGVRATLDWLANLKNHESRRDGRPIAGRTAWNIASVVKVFLEPRGPAQAARPEPPRGCDVRGLPAGEARQGEGLARDGRLHAR